MRHGQGGNDVRGEWVSSGWLVGVDLSGSGQLSLGCIQSGQALPGAGGQQLPCTGQRCAYAAHC